MAADILNDLREAAERIMQPCRVVQLLRCPSFCLLAMLRVHIQHAGKGVAGVSELACLDHPRLVNAAYFSPQSGSKLMSTCIDNRLRVWDYLHSIDKPCDREIVHSHDFNRYLTPFRAEWDPKDPHERLLVVGR